MAVQKLTPRYLNKDNDERLIKPSEMTDAVNVRISSDKDSDALVLKNAYGNTAVDLNASMPAGDNKVIGSVSDEQLGVIFYFVWNSNGDHSIYQYNANANKSYRVIKDSVLDFTEFGFVKGNIYINNNQDVLLYFTDGRTAPKKINVTKALTNGYPQLLTGTDDEKLAILTTAKRPPLDPPVYNIVRNANLKENNIKDEVFQFAYKYIYDDGEHSALSPYSSLTVSQNQMRRGFTNTGQDNFFNQINVFLKYSPYDVAKLQLYARKGNEGAFYEVAEIDNNTTGTTATVAFTNSEDGVALSQSEQNKLYDNVPQIADSQEIVNGRLVYGGYTEGYENVSTEVSLEPNYGYEGTVYDVDVAVGAGGALTFGQPATPNFDNIPSNGLPSGSRVYINISINADYFQIGGQTYSDKLDWDNITVTYTKKDGTDTDNITLTKTEDPIKFLASGIHITSVIDFPTAVSKAVAIVDILAAITSQKYSVSLKSAGGETTALQNAGINLVEEKAIFTGHAIFTAQKISGVDEIQFYLSELDLYIVELFVGGVQREILSSPVIHMETPTHELSFRMFSQYISGGIFATEDDVESKAFKSGSSHKLGIVYYDEANRSSGVQELDQVYVESLNDRSSENDLYGPASIVMRVLHSPPSWAKRWAPVYYGKGSNRLKLMYGIAGAYIPFRSDADLQISPSKTIYLSLSTIFSESAGYNTATGANLSYEYSKGDKLRIISYDGNSRTTSEFNVVGLKNLSNGDDNPILDQSSSRSLEYTTGQFVVIEENKSATGFTINEILDKNSSWFKECIVEIYNPSKENTNIYYEIGKNYEISSGNHIGERTTTSVPITVTQGTATAVEFNSDVKVFKGDILVLGGVTINVGNVYEKKGKYYAFGTANTTATSGTYTVSNTQAVVQLDLGDVYFRRRNIFVSAKNKSNISTGDEAYPSLSSLARYIEDYSVSDFFSSDSISIGRPIAHIPNAKTVKRKGSITYSEFDSEDNTRLNLSSFNLSLANFKDFASEHGSIKYLVGYNDVLYYLQEKRCGRVGVGKQVLQAGDGDNIVSLSTDIFGNEQYYVGEYGIGTHPESVAFRDGMVYFADVNAKKVLRIDSQGLTAISDVGMDTYFKDKLSQISKYQTNLVGGGIDTDSDGYLIHSSAFQLGTISVAGNTYEANVSGSTVLLPVVYNPSAIFKFNTEQRTFDTICDMFDQSVEAVVYLDQIGSGGVVYTSLPYQSSTILGVATDTNYSFFSMILVNSYIPGFIAYTSFCDGDSDMTISEDGAVTDSFNAEYSTSDRVWTTTYSFDPERVDSVHAHMYSFKNGKIYKHSSDADRNTWYGEATEASVIEVISNEAPSAIKTFESLSIESTKPWSVTVSTRTQSAVVNSASLVEKESFYYGYIHGATSSYGSTITSVSSTSEFFSLGAASAASTGATVTFNTDLSYVAMPLGSVSTLYKVNGSQLDSQSVYPVSVSGNSVTFSGNVAVLTGNEFVVVANSSVEGDQIRDYYAKLRLTTTTSEPLELFAVNSVFADSKAHN